MVIIAVLFVAFLFFRYEEENISIAGETYVIRTDRLFGDDCVYVYPTRKYTPMDMEKIAAIVSANTDLEMCDRD